MKLGFVVYTAIRMSTLPNTDLPRAAPRPAIHPLMGMVIAVLAVSTASVFIRQAQQDAPSIVIATYRLGLAALLLAPVTLSCQRAELRAMGPPQWGLALVSGVLLGFHFILWITSLEYTTVASSTVLVGTLPLFVGLLSPLLLHEVPGRGLMAGMALAIVGGSLMALSDACLLRGLQFTCPSASELLYSSALYGDGLALLGAITGAGYFIVGRRLRAGLPLLAYIFVVYGVAALVLLATALGAGLPLWGYPRTTYLWFLLLAAVPQLIGHSSLNWALGYLPAAFVAIVFVGEPAGSTVLAWLLLNETPTWLQLLGGALALSGIGYASRKL
ncbi:MAG TPA: DMT family transporter [Anaerolineales bacterium]|jgi:drug/metabolite transporter (DMT)-like permease|nr:DMT family transporter [Anaerolineales bacterium]